MVVHTFAQLERRLGQEKIIAITFFVVTWISVLLRVYVRGHMIHGFGWDDTTMLAAQLAFSMYCVSYLVILGLGTAIDLNLLLRITKWTIATEVLYIVTMCFLKISFGIFFIRIVIERWQRVVVYVPLAISTLQSIEFFFFIIFRCGVQIDDYLTREATGKCASHTATLATVYTGATANAVTDWIFASLPIPLLWNAHVDIRTKYSVGFIMALGAAGSICSVVRMFYINGLNNNAEDDFFWNAAMSAIWSTIEPGVGIFAGSLATLRPLFRLVFSNVRDFTSALPSRNLSMRMPASSRSANIAVPNKILVGNRRDFWKMRQDSHNGDDSVELPDRNFAQTALYTGT